MIDITRTAVENKETYVHPFEMIHDLFHDLSIQKIVFFFFLRMAIIIHTAVHPQDKIHVILYAPFFHQRKDRIYRTAAGDPKQQASLSAFPYRMYVSHADLLIVPQQRAIQITDDHLYIFHIITRSIITDIIVKIHYLNTIVNDMPPLSFCTNISPSSLRMISLQI